MTNGTNDQIEEAMLARFIAERLKGVATFVHLRLGQPANYNRENPAPRAVRSLYLSTLAEADLVTHTLDAATIYEFTIWKPTAKLGQLLHYRQLLPATPGFEDVSEDRVKMVLVSGQYVADVAQTARIQGIEFITYLPADIAVKVAERRGGA